MTLDSQPYYLLCFDVILKFGLTELTAEISFEGNVSFMISIECMELEFISTCRGRESSKFICCCSVHFVLLTPLLPIAASSLPATIFYEAN